MLIVVAAVIDLLLANLGKPKHEVAQGPDGQAAVRIICERRDDCADEAKRACPGGHETLSVDGKTSPSTTWSRLIHGFSRGSSEPRYQGVWVIRCK